MPFYSDDSTPELVRAKATEVSDSLIKAQGRQPLIMNIDPTDPVTGYGGLSVAVKDLNDTKVKQAVARGGGDPYSVWSAVAEAHKPAAASVEPQPSPPAEEIDLSQFNAVPDLPQTPSPQPALPPQPAPAPQPDLTALANSVATLADNQQRLLQYLAQQQRDQQQQEQQELATAAADEPGPAKHKLAVPEESGMAKFLGEPDKPRVPVVFDLGLGGVHRVYFHHVSRMGSSIMLLYDDRYDGHRFIPPVTPPGKSISVTFPGESDNVESIEVNVLPLNNTFFHLDIVQLLILKPTEADQPPSSSGMYVQDMP